MERENYVNHLKDPQNYQNTNRHDKGKNSNNRVMQTSSGQDSTIVAEPLPGHRNTYFNPGPRQNSGYSVRRSGQDSRDSDIGTRQDYGEFGFRTPQRNALGNELEYAEGDFSKKQNSGDTRKGSSHRRDNEKDRNIRGFASEQGCIVVEPFPGQRIHPGPGRNSSFRIPKLGQKSRGSDTGTRQNEADSTEASEQQIAAGTELNHEPTRISCFRIPKLGQKSRGSDIGTRQNEDDLATATDEQIASGNEMEKNEGEFGTRPKQNSGEVRTGSGRFGSGPRPRSGKIGRDGRAGYDSREFKSGQSRRESHTAGLDVNGDGLRRGKGQNSRAKSPSNTNYNWRDRD